MKIIKKIAACFIAFSLVFGGISVHASNPSARNISIFRVDGDNVSLSRGDARTTTPRDGQRLSDGNIITTGLASSVFIQMDTNSILQMAASSRVAVGQSTGNLVLSVQSGSALVEVRDQSPGQTTETRIGNVGLTVRGTMYTMGLFDGFVSIVMLSGHGEVEGEPLYAGQIMHVFDEHVPGTDVLYYETGYFRLINFCPDTLGILDLFTLEAMYEHRDYLLEVGSLTPDMLDLMPYYIHGRRIEAAETRPVESTQEFPTVIIPIPPPEPGDENGEEELTPPPPLPPPPPPPDNGNGGNVVVPPPLPEGSGTASDPFNLRNVADMERHFGTTHPTGWAGLVFKLHTDIVGWSSVIGGSPFTPFEGRFYGNGHRITININSDDYPRTGLFAAVSGHVEDLYVSGTISSNSIYVGGIAGSLNGTMYNVRAENITVIGSHAPAFLGGIVGVIESGGVINRAYTSATVKGFLASGVAPRHAGGVAGQVELNGVVENVTLNASLQVFNAELNGAIVGYHMGLISGIIANDLPADHPLYSQMVGGGSGIVINFASFGFSMDLLVFNDLCECEYVDCYCKDYPAKEDEEDEQPAKDEDEEDDYSAKNEEDDEDDADYDKEHDKELDDVFDYEDEYTEDAEYNAGYTDYPLQDDEYEPTSPEDDFELYGNDE